jgi:FKBP-type peptidyl-prolyl cis-trans isomerase (trigger factor)
LRLQRQHRAAPSKSYQVTGPVLEVSDSLIAIQKGKERWEITRATKAGGDVKVGDRVTIEYTMTATKIEVKPDKSAKREGTSPSPAPSAEKK